MRHAISFKEESKSVIEVFKLLGTDGKPIIPSGICVEKGELPGYTAKFSDGTSHWIDKNSFLQRLTLMSKGSK